MPNEKISDLVDGSPPQNTDEFVVARGGDNFKIPWSAMAPPAVVWGQDSVFILGFTTPGSETNFDNISATVTNPAGFGTRYSDNTNGAFVIWPVTLLEGTYSLVLGSVRYNGSGIVRFALDDGGGFVDVDDPPYNGSGATADTYGTDGIGLPYEICSDLEIPATGTYDIRAMIDGKNGSSSGFATNLVYIYLKARVIA